MKFKLFSLICLLTLGITTVYGQQQRDSLYRNADFEILSAKFFSSRSAAPQTGIVVDIEKRTKLKGSLPLRQGNLGAIYLNTELTSNNDFTPLFDKGKWAASAAADVSYTLFLNRDSRYDVADNGTLSRRSFLKPERGFWIWTTAALGYNFNSYLFYLDNNNPDIERQISRKNYNNITGRGSLGFYFAPFYGRMNALSFTGSLGFEYRQNDNNYAAMRSVVVNSYQKVDGADNQAIEVNSNKVSAKQGQFIVADASMINYNLTILFDTESQLSFGLNVYGRTRLTAALKSTDLGFGLNIPLKHNIANERRVLMNLNLNYEVIDINNRLNPNFHFGDKGYLGLGIAIPIYTLSYK